MTVEEIFRFRAPDFARLAAYGFRERKGVFVYSVPLMEGQFLLTVTVSREGEVQTELLDAAFGEPYTLHLVGEAEGEFVGEVREAFFAARSEISERCFFRKVFRLEATYALLALARERYGDEPEYLWEKFPDCAVLRRKDNAKWYAAILTVERRKAGMRGEGKTELLDVRADPREVPLLVDGERIFGAWHMNKKSWIGLPLDGTLSQDEIANFLEESRFLAGEK